MEFLILFSIFHIDSLKFYFLKQIIFKTSFKHLSMKKNNYIVLVPLSKSFNFSINSNQSHRENYQRCFVLKISKCMDI